MKTLRHYPIALVKTVDSIQPIAGDSPGGSQGGQLRILILLKKPVRAKIACCMSLQFKAAILRDFQKEGVFQQNQHSTIDLEHEPVGSGT